MPRFDDTIDLLAALAAVRRLMNQVRDLHPEIERHGVTIPREAVAEIERFREEIMHEVPRHREDASVRR